MDGDEAKADDSSTVSQLTSAASALTAASVLPSDATHSSSAATSSATSAATQASARASSVARSSADLSSTDESATGADLSLVTSVESQRKDLSRLLDKRLQLETTFDEYQSQHDADKAIVKNQKDVLASLSARIDARIREIKNMSEIVPTTSSVSNSALLESYQAQIDQLRQQVFLGAQLSNSGTLSPLSQQPNQIVIHGSQQPLPSYVREIQAHPLQVQDIRVQQNFPGFCTDFEDKMGEYVRNQTPRERFRTLITQFLLCFPPREREQFSYLKLLESCSFVDAAKIMHAAIAGADDQARLLDELFNFKCLLKVGTITETPAQSFSRYKRLHERVYGNTPLLPLHALQLFRYGSFPDALKKKIQDHISREAQTSRVTAQESLSEPVRELLNSPALVTVAPTAEQISELVAFYRLSKTFCSVKDLFNIAESIFQDHLRQGTADQLNWPPSANIQAYFETLSEFRVLTSAFFTKALPAATSSATSSSVPLRSNSPHPARDRTFAAAASGTKSTKAVDPNSSEQCTDCSTRKPHSVAQCWQRHPHLKEQFEARKSSSSSGAAPIVQAFNHQQQQLVSASAATSATAASSSSSSASQRSGTQPTRGVITSQRGGKSFSS